MNIKEAINKGISILKENDVEEASLNAKMLLEFILNLRREELIINLEKEINKTQEEKFFENINKIAQGYPIQYITKHKEFMKLDFYIDENVLVPRADTEILVEEAIKIAKEENKKEILDMCTGSGEVRYINCKISR